MNVSYGSWFPYANVPMREELRRTAQPRARGRARLQESWPHDPFPRTFEKVKCSQSVSHVSISSSVSSSSGRPIAPLASRPSRSAIIALWRSIEHAAFGVSSLQWQSKLESTPDTVHAGRFYISTRQPDGVHSVSPCLCKNRKTESACSDQWPILLGVMFGAKPVASGSEPPAKRVDALIAPRTSRVEWQSARFPSVSTR